MQLNDYLDLWKIELNQSSITINDDIFKHGAQTKNIKNIITKLEKLSLGAKTSLFFGFKNIKQQYEQILVNNIQYKTESTNIDQSPTIIKHTSLDSSNDKYHKIKTQFLHLLSKNDSIHNYLGDRSTIYVTNDRYIDNNLSMYEDVKLDCFGEVLFCGGKHEVDDIIVWNEVFEDEEWLLLISDAIDCYETDVRSIKNSRVYGLMFEYFEDQFKSKNCTIQRESNRSNISTPPGMRIVYTMVHKVVCAIICILIHKKEPSNIIGAGIGKIIILYLQNEIDIVEFVENVLKLSVFLATSKSSKIGRSSEVNLKLIDSIFSNDKVKEKLIEDDIEFDSGSILGGWIGCCLFCEKQYKDCSGLRFAHTYKFHTNVKQIKSTKEPTSYSIIGKIDFMGKTKIVCNLLLFQDFRLQMKINKLSESDQLLSIHIPVDDEIDFKKLNTLLFRLSKNNILNLCLFQENGLQEHGVIEYLDKLNFIFVSFSTFIDSANLNTTLIPNYRL